MKKSILFFIPYGGCGNAGQQDEICLKMLVSSLQRTYCDGDILAFRKNKQPLFRIERRNYEEIVFNYADRFDSRDDLRLGEQKTFFNFVRTFDPGLYEWIVVMDAAGLALRNMDHLLPSAGVGIGQSPPVDLYWVPTAGGTEEPGASPGIWAVRGEKLSEVAAFWEKTMEVVPDIAGSWSRTIRDVPLNKRRFETGETIAPAVDAVPWADVSHSSFVTVPTWPASEQLRFAQSLYFGTYFADSTGLLVNILES